MLWIHPVWQVITILLGLYIFHQGWERFAATSLGRKGQFQWKRHVILGKAAIYMWIYGACVGAAAAWVRWRTFGVTGVHFWLGIAIVCLAVFGYWSGLHMDNHKMKRKILPIIHGTGNFLLLIMALISIGTGTGIIQKLLK